jgi:hypothetical protein
MYRSTLKATLLAMTFLALSTSLLAQQTGSIVGTVADKTGAVIANAKVTLTNAATKDIRHTMTNGEGFFAFSGTVVGDYSVKAEMDGFQTAEVSGIHLSPGDRRNLNVSLAVRAAEQTITVEATASTIVVDSGDLSSTLYANNISRNPIQGRDVTENLKTLPGFNINTSMGGLQNKNPYNTQVTSIGSAVGLGYTGNGAPERAGGADLTSDGAHILDAGCNCNALATLNADMVQEVKVTTSAYSSDVATGPIVVSAVTKSGSSEYHGNGYLHFRDSAMNSNDYNFKQNNLAKPNDRYWYPGGQFGGPVPFTHKKLVFFTAYEYYNQRFPDGTGGGMIKAQVPTDSMRQGLFDPTLADNQALCQAMAGWISGQYRCQPFTSINTMDGNVSVTNQDISAYIAPGAKALLNMIPKPNHVPTSAFNYNVVYPLMNTNNGYMFRNRVDYAFSETTKLYVTFTQQHQNYGDPLMRWWAPGDAINNLGDIASSDMSRTLAGSLIKVFNPTTTNEFLFGLGYLDSPRTIRNPKAVSRTAQGYPYKTPGTATIMPGFVNSWWNTDFGIPLLLDSGRAAYLAHKVQPSFNDNLTKVLRTHTLKAGVSWLRSGNRESGVDQGNPPNGMGAYGPIFGDVTSALDPVVNFMLDRVTGFGYTPVTVADMKASGWGFYGQDEWKTTRRLTLNFGMRFSHDSPFEDNTGKYGVPVWTRALYDADVAKGITSMPGIRWHAIDKSVPLSGRTVNALFYAPRFGIAFDLFGTGKTVLRGGIGSYYFADGLPGSAGVSIPTGGTLCSMKVGNAFLGQLDTDPTNTISCAGTVGGFTSVTANDPRDHVEPRTLTYNFTISQHAPLRSVLEVTYAGSQTSDLINPLKDINIIPIGTFMKPDPNPNNTGQWTDKEGQSHPIYGSVLPINLINGDDNLKQDFKPFREFKQLNLIRRGAWANYNALQVSWSKQRGALNFNLNYTWSKTMGIGATPDAINIHNDYAILSQDRPHVLNASYSYEVGNRFHRGQGCEDLVHCGGFLGVLLNGWMISGITNLQSGVPMQQNTINFGLGGTNDIADSNLNSINTTYYLGTATANGGTTYNLMPAITCAPATGLASGQYINSKCFGLPETPVFDSENRLIQLGGQGPYHSPIVRGPAYFSSDLSLARTIKITERQNVQVKFTAMNFLNHPLKSFDQNASNNYILNYTNGVLTTQGNGWRYGFTNEKFGRRVLEMSLKYNF